MQIVHCNFASLSIAAANIRDAASASRTPLMVGIFCRLSCLLRLSLLLLLSSSSSAADSVNQHSADGRPRTCKRAFVQAKKAESTAELSRGTVSAGGGRVGQSVTLLNTEWRLSDMCSRHRLLPQKTRENDRGEKGGQARICTSLARPSFSFSLFTSKRTFFLARMTHIVAAHVSRE